MMFPDEAFIDFLVSRERKGKFSFADKTFAVLNKHYVKRAYPSWFVIMVKEKRNFILYLIKEGKKR